MRYIHSFPLLILMLSSCGKIPIPSLLSPSENRNIQKVSYGQEPVSYQKILKNYLIKNLANYKEAKVEFVNKPSKLSIDHLGDNYSGYRICLSVNEKRGEYYTGYKNHFFLLNNNKVTLHLYDSGLLIIPFEYCVARKKKNEISIENMDIVEINRETIPKSNDESSIAKVDKNIYKLNTYIICDIDDIEYTYIFNENNSTFLMVDGLKEMDYQVSFNQAYIVAFTQDIEITINRVSGTVVQTLTDESKSGICKLLDKTKF